jgi:hypothetical protein
VANHKTTRVIVKLREFSCFLVIDFISIELSFIYRVWFFFFCRVHYTIVRTKKELEETIERIGRSPLNWVVEVESNIERNSEFHRFLQSSVTQAANRAFRIFSMFTSMCGQGSDNKLQICGVELSRYK